VTNHLYHGYKYYIDIVGTTSVTGNLDTPHTYNSKVGADYGIHFEKAEYLATNGQ
jgi:hypothetical protein